MIKLILIYKGKLEGYVMKNVNGRVSMENCQDNTLRMTKLRKGHCRTKGTTNLKEKVNSKIQIGKLIK